MIYLYCVWYVFVVYGISYYIWCIFIIRYLCYILIYYIHKSPFEYLLDNNDIKKKEIAIDDTPYNNRYKRRFVKVVEIIDNHSFKIDIELKEVDIFIYGKKVEDFKRLDYESLYCLNIAGTQELYKLIMEQREEINNLKNRLSILESINNSQ